MSACPSCATELPSEARFCMSCGTKLDEAAPTTQKVALPASVDKRYDVRAFLGEGARKRVYLAHDTRLGREVAVAVVKTDGLDADGLERVRREARAMARLGDHPNIVTIYDIADDENDTPYVVSQFMSGGALSDLLEAQVSQRLPVHDAVRVAMDVTTGLVHAHARGVVHRDIKPANIFLTAEGTAQLGDFGLAVAEGLTRLTHEGMMVGTAAYMAPEQALGQAPDSRCDLYSLGCVLYEALCGRTPFVGDDIVAVVGQHMHTPPVAPSWHVAGIPPSLEALVLRLLEKDPSRRPASAEDVLAALRTVTVDERDPSIEQPRPPDNIDPVYRRVFVGREAELAQLQQALDGAVSGTGTLVLVVGEPGIGKTSICEQLATYARMRGGTVLVGHCYEEGSLSLPYLPFVEALRSYVMSREPDALRSELGSHAAEVARIVSEVRERVQVEPRTGGDPEEERYRLMEGVTAFLRSASASQPILLVLEDLHDADGGTLELLTFLARRLEGARLMVAGTYRDVEVDRAHPLSGALAELRRGGAITRVALRGLSPDEVQRMFSQIVSQNVPWGLSESIHRQTEGNPLFVQEVIRYLAQEGLIAREDGRWRRTSSTPLAMAIPEGLRDVIGKRLSGLSQGANRALAVAAVIGREFRLDVLQDVGGLTEEELYRALEEATQAAVVEERQGPGGVVRYRFAHAFFRQTLYEETIAPRRIRLHQQVARATEAVHAGRLEEHAAELADHYSYSSDADDLAKAVSYGEMAARRAVAVYAHDEAVRLLDRALEVEELLEPRDPGRRCKLLLQLGEGLLASGQSLRAMDEVSPEAFAVAEAAGDRSAAFRSCWLWFISRVQHAGGVSPSNPDARVWVDRADRCAEAESWERVWVDVRVAARLASEWDQEGANALRASARELAHRINDPVAKILAFNGMFPTPRTLDERVADFEELRRLPLERVPSWLVESFLQTSVLLALGIGDRDAAEQLSALIRERGERTRDATVQLRPLQTELLTFAMLDGRLDDVLVARAELRSRADELGRTGMGEMFFLAAPVFEYLGRYEEVLTEMADVERDREGAQYSPVFKARVLAALGRTSEARAQLEEFRRTRELASLEDMTLPNLVNALDAAVTLGDRDLAARYASALAPALRWRNVPRQLARAAVLLGDQDRAPVYFKQALENAERIRDRPQTALTHVDFAEFLADQGERREALTHLEAAIPELSDMGMRPGLERALRLRLRLQGVDPSSSALTSIATVGEAVARERPSLEPATARDGTVTLLFTDIEGSTALNERLGDSAWLDILRAHNERVREQVPAHNGIEVKSQGDGFMLAFASPDDALHCAIAIQRSVSALDVRVRAGLHTGPVVKEGQDFYGRNVTLACRIADAAQGGEVLVSDSVRSVVAGATFSGSRTVELKGFSGTHEVHVLDWTKTV